VVRRRIPVEGVDEVRNSICGGTKVGERVDPAHRKPEWQGYHWFGAGLGREDDADGDVGRIDADAVETVGDIDSLSLSFSLSTRKTLKTRYLILRL
jgi:hypothetical protein